MGWCTTGAVQASLGGVPASEKGNYSANCEQPLVKTPSPTEVRSDLASRNPTHRRPPRQLPRALRHNYVTFSTPELDRKPTSFELSVSRIPPFLNSPVLESSPLRILPFLNSPLHAVPLNTGSSKSARPLAKEKRSISLPARPSWHKHGPPVQIPGPVSTVEWSGRGRPASPMSSTRRVLK